MSLRDVLGDFKTDMLISEMNEVQEKLNKLGLKSPRPWREFASAFKKPKNKQEIEERVQSNFMLYRANYILVLAGIMSWSIIISPFTMGVLLICAGVFALLLGRSGPIEVLGRVLTSRDKMLVAGGFSIFLLLVTGAMVKLIWSFLFAVLVMVTHMAFRPRSPGHRNSLNEEINLSHSINKGREAAEDIESPGHEDSGSMGSYHSETQLRGRTKSQGSGRES